MSADDLQVAGQEMLKAEALALFWGTAYIRIDRYPLCCDEHNKYVYKAISPEFITEAISSGYDRRPEGDGTTPPAGEEH